MVQKDRLGVAGADPSRSRRRSKSPSPSRKKKTAAARAAGALPPPYTEIDRYAPFAADAVDPAVKDNDIFLLPSSDYTVMFVLTAVAVAVRLFRIYQPSSVVFDEVQ